MTSPESPPTIPSTLTSRILGAALLRVRIYEEVEHDMAATGQAAVVVGIVALAGAVGGIRGGAGGLIAGVVSAYLGWALWSAICFVVGTRLFDGRATWGELLRTIGFAQTPGILLALGAIPGLARPVPVIVYLWMIATVFVAIRQALDLGTGRAIAATLAGFVPYALAKALTEILFGVTPSILP